ncbi:uncharacterized protein [Ptychodera flava]|uniref:uncharacterized protein n=1 Tax=Ptychodera flava TaxID=63121 RepID=UPI00396A99F2
MVSPYRLAIISVSIILWAAVRCDDEPFCERCRARFDEAGREYEDNCTLTPSCPSDLLDMVQDIRDGLVDVAGELSPYVGVRSSGEPYTWLSLPEGLLGTGLSMGEGPGDELSDSCARCNMRIYENGVTGWDCEDTECPEEFVGNFSWVPFKPIVTIIPNEICVYEDDEDMFKFFCYYNI